MHENENQDLVSSLFTWLAYSVLIPALAIFLRWLVPVFLYGPDSVDPLTMMRSSEVVFLAAVLVAETLGRAPGRRILDSNPFYRSLIMIQALLMVLLVLSLMVFGAFTPLETTASSDFLPWLSTPGGQRFHAWFNLALFVFVFAIVLIARGCYWKAGFASRHSRHPKPSEDIPVGVDSEGREC